MGEVVEPINVLYGCGRVGVKVSLYLKLIDYIDNTNDKYMDNLFKFFPIYKNSLFIHFRFLYSPSHGYKERMCCSVWRWLVQEKWLALGRTDMKRT